MQINYDELKSNRIKSDIEQLEYAIETFQERMDEANSYVTALLGADYNQRETEDIQALLKLLEHALYTFKEKIDEADTKATSILIEDSAFYESNAHTKTKEHPVAITDHDESTECMTPRMLRYYILSHSESSLEHIITSGSISIDADDFMPFIKSKPETHIISSSKDYFFTSKDIESLFKELRKTFIDTYKLPKSPPVLPHKKEPAEYPKKKPLKYKPPKRIHYRLVSRNAYMDARNRPPKDSPNES